MKEMVLTLPIKVRIDCQECGKPLLFRAVGYDEERGILLFEVEKCDCEVRKNGS